MSESGSGKERLLCTMTTATTTLLIAKVRNVFVHVSPEIANYVEYGTVYAVFWRTRCFPGITPGSDMEEWWGMASQERCFQGQQIVDHLCDYSEHVQVMHRHHHDEAVLRVCLLLFYV